MNRAKADKIDLDEVARLVDALERDLADVRADRATCSY
jgi:hypothetical protein